MPNKLRSVHPQQYIQLGMNTQHVDPISLLPSVISAVQTARQVVGTTTLYKLVAAFTFTIHTEQIRGKQKQTHSNSHREHSQTNINLL